MRSQVNERAKIKLLATFHLAIYLALESTKEHVAIVEIVFDVEAEAGSILLSPVPTLN